MVYASILKNTESELKVQNFKEKVIFPEGSTDDIIRIVKWQKEKYNRLKKIEQGKQARLPYEFRDRTALNDIELQIEDAEYRELNMKSVYIFGKKIIITCGRHI